TFTIFLLLQIAILASTIRNMEGKKAVSTLMHQLMDDGAALHFTLFASPQDTRRSRSLKTWASLTSYQKPLIAVEKLLPCLNRREPSLLVTSFIRLSSAFVSRNVHKCDSL
ncbi:unnamed protein product, partial [Darwinula stevensoni]